MEASILQSLERADRVWVPVFSWEATKLPRSLQGEGGVAGVRVLGGTSLAPSSPPRELGKIGLRDCPCESKTRLEGRKVRTAVAQAQGGIGLR